MKRCFASLLALSILFVIPINAQTQPDPALIAEINKIKAIDNHAHPQSIAGEGGREDEEYDAIACGKLEFVSPPPV